MCPLCGAPREAFEPVAPEPAPVAQAAVQNWRCLNCGYVHAGAEPPATCPVCDAPADCFEAEVESGQQAAEASKTKKVIVVGGGAAGVAAAESLRNMSSAVEIALLCKETTEPYYRLNLTRYLCGDIGDKDLPIKPAGWYEQQNIELVRGVEVSKLDLDGGKVELHDGKGMPYDKLILAVGAHPFVPPFPGVSRDGVTCLRTIEDAKRILGMKVAGKRCVCIGGGLLGLETAGALARQGSDVTLLEGHGWPLPRQLSETAGLMLAGHVGESGIKLKTMARTHEIVGDERVRGVLLEDESTMAADLVVIATGVRPNSYLARMAGLEVNNGVVVDNLLRTSHPDIFAAGDVAEHRGVSYGTWAPAQYQGGIAGMNAMGGHTEFGGIPRSNTLKVLDLEMFSIGQIQPLDGSYEVVEQQTDSGYLRFVFHDSHMIGGILLGDAQDAPRVKKAIEGRTDFSRLLLKRPSARDVARFIEEGMT